MEASDLDLLHAARQGDERAFAELMRRHEDRIFSLAYRMLGDRSDALDATQDTFINVFRRAGDFRGDSQFSTWVYRIAINACKDLLRRKARTPVPHEDPPEPPAAAGPPAFEETIALRADLSDALAKLPEEYREAVVMFDLGAIPYEEIARITGSAIGTVKSRISRGRKRLAILLEQQGSPAPSKEQT